MTDDAIIKKAIALLESDGDVSDAIKLLKKALMPELLPCPFCGAMPDLVDEGINVWLSCDCGIRTLSGDPDCVAEVWNRRVNE